MPRETFQCPHPCGEPLPTQAFIGGPLTLTGCFGSVSCWVTVPLLWVLVYLKLCLCPPRLESLFPSVILLALKAIPCGFPSLCRVPIPLYDPQAGKIQTYAPTNNTEDGEVEWFYEDLKDLLELTPRKYVLFIIGDWNAKVGSQETPGVTGKLGLGVQNEAGQRLIEF